MAAITRPQAGAEATGDVIDFSGVNIFALTAAVLLIFAFIFMPWTGTQLADNGARYMSDTLYGAIGAQSSLLILLVPLAGLVGGGLALWGMMTPDKGRLASRLIAIPGAMGLVFYAAVLLNLVPSPINERGAGIGFWVGLFCLLAFVGQLAGGNARLAARAGGATSSLGRIFPTIPRKWVPYLFLLAPLVLYLIWIILPTLYTFYLSMTRWEGFGEPVWVGFENFERLLGIGRPRPDRDFVQAIINNTRWLTVFITVPTTMGLGLAMIFNTDMRGGRWFKVSFYSPLVLSYPVIALVWLWLYNPRLGLINSLLTSIGVADPPSWIADSNLAIWCIIIAAVWRQVGYVMVLYLAGLKNIDPTLIDAALVDGADRWNLFRRVIFPLLAPVTTIIIVISIIDSLRAFDLVQVMTRGNNQTETLANFMYIEAFNNYNMGYGAAIAVVLFGISLIFIGFYLSRVVRDELEF